MVGRTRLSVQSGESSEWADKHVRPTIVHSILRHSGLLMEPNPLLQTRPRVLVIRGGAIGDFILTLPAIRLLREGLPNPHLEVLGYPGIASLATAAGFADAVRSIEHGAMAPFSRPAPSSIRAFRTTSPASHWSFPISMTPMDSSPGT